MEYASSVWDPTNRKKIENLEKVQKRAARFISWQLVPVPDGLGEERISEGLTARSFLIKAIFASSPAVVGLDILVAVLHPW
jgi:hypothetical protein